LPSLLVFVRMIPTNRIRGTISNHSSDMCGSPRVSFRLIRLTVLTRCFHPRISSLNDGADIQTTRRVLAMGQDVAIPIQETAFPRGIKGAKNDPLPGEHHLSVRPLLPLLSAVTDYFGVAGVLAWSPTKRPWPQKHLNSELLPSSLDTRSTCASLFSWEPAACCHKHG
jgi:hypothetical protein